MGKCNDSVKEQRSEHFEEVETTQFVLDSIFVDLDITVQSCSFSLFQIAGWTIKCRYGGFNSLKMSRARDFFYMLIVEVKNVRSHLRKCQETSFLRLNNLDSYPENVLIDIADCKIKSIISK